MRRNKELLKKREEFVVNYINNSPGKTMKTIILELVDRLFVCEKTIWNIWKEYRDNKRKENEQKTT